MEQVIAMSKLPFTIVCTPLCISALLLNAFLIFCLCKPAVGVSLRQPMRLLLSAVLGNSTFQQSIALISVVLCYFPTPYWLRVGNVALSFQTYGASFSLNAWISIYYYMKIVPQRYKCFIWVKKNIKGIIYAGFLLDQTLLLSALTMGTVSYLLPSPKDNVNVTVLTGKTVVNTSLYTVSVKMCLVYLICPSFTLSISWGRTFCFLRNHMKKMEQTTGSSSGAQHKNQMRVTIMGIVQTALFLPSSVYAIAMGFVFSTLYETLDIDKRITMTVMSMSNLANISCLGYSQSVFRVRLVALLKGMKKAFGLVDQS